MLHLLLLISVFPHCHKIRNINDPLEVFSFNLLLTEPVQLWVRSGCSGPSLSQVQQLSQSGNFTISNGSSAKTLVLWRTVSLYSARFPFPVIHGSCLLSVCRAHLRRVWLHLLLYSPRVMAECWISRGSLTSPAVTSPAADPPQLPEISPACLYSQQSPKTDEVLQRHPNEQEQRGIVRPGNPARIGFYSCRSQVDDTLDVGSIRTPRPPGEEMLLPHLHRAFLCQV